MNSIKLARGSMHYMKRIIEFSFLNSFKKWIQHWMKVIPGPRSSYMTHIAVKHNFSHIFPLHPSLRSLWRIVKFMINYFEHIVSEYPSVWVCKDVGKCTILFMYLCLSSINVLCARCWKFRMNKLEESIQRAFTLTLCLWGASEC